MSLVMDPPVHLRDSLAAARKRVSAATRSHNNNNAGNNNKQKSSTLDSDLSSSKQPQQSQRATPSTSALQAVAFHFATACVAGLLLHCLGLTGGWASLAVVAGIAIAILALGVPNPLWKAVVFIRSTQGQESRRKICVDNWIDNYNDLHHKDSDYVRDGDRAGVDRRNTSYATLVNAYYELATLFYEIGWGTSFHFATRRKHETFTESIKRHEYYLAGKLRTPDNGPDMTGKRVLDVGCGIGGPYRNIAKFTGADVTGITLNEYQVQRGNRLSSDDELLSRCRSVQGDFMKLPFKDESFDGAYAIEATCHAPSRQGVYSEIYRVLKPGATFAMYEWCLTPDYDSNSAQHRHIKKQIEEGDGLPDMARTTDIDEAISAVGFEVLESRDLALDVLPGDIPWYTPLTPSWNIFTQRFQFTSVGKWLTTNGLRLLEFLRLAPAGTCKVQTMLLAGGEGCYRGGELGIFTPMYLCVVRKPLDAAEPVEPIAEPATAE